MDEFLPGLEALAGCVDVLMDPGDDVAVTRGLLARHDPAAGLVVVHPTATTRQRLSLAHDMLAALGAPIEALGAERLGGADAAWRAVRTWLTVDRVAHLVVLRAHRLDPRVWSALGYLAQTTHTQLLLVCHHPTIPTPLRAALAAMPLWVFHSLPEVVAFYRWDTHPVPRRRPPAPPRWPTLSHGLPVGQVMHYRADIHRRHSPEVFAAVDELYGRGLDAACEWLRGRPRPGPGGRPGAGARIQAFVGELVHASPSPRHTVALLRGAQAGFLLHGCWLILPPVHRLLGGPGFTSTPVTHAIVDRIRAGTANPVLAAAVALALFTGVEPAALASLRMAALDPPAHLLTVPYKTQRMPSDARQRYHSIPLRHADAVFYVPLPARRLLRAARLFLLAHDWDPEARVFAGFFPLHQLVEQAAARCGLALPRRPVPLLGLWQLRVGWTRLGAPVHPDPPDLGRPAGSSCHTATPPAPAPAAAPIYRRPYEKLGRRWAPTGDAPDVLPRLLRAHLDGAPLRLPPRTHTLRPGVPPPEPEANRRRRLVERHLAVRLPPEPNGDGDRLTVHPDIAFALRLTDRPCPAEPARDGD
jgi:hypothetical protein